MKIEEYISTRLPSLNGKVFLITGANAGIGFSATKILALKGAKVLMACRNLKKAEIAKENILKICPQADLEVVQYDQESKASIQEFNRELLVKSLRIDSFIFNAGIVHPQKGLLTKDGFPLTVGTNFLGEYFAVQEMQELIQKGMVKRFVFETSIARHLGLTKQYQKYFTKEHRGTFQQYNVSKNMIFEYACLLEQDQTFKTEVVLAHPGIANTNIISEEHSSFSKVLQKLGHIFLRFFANSSDKSALAIVEAAIGSSQANYYFPRHPFHIKGFPNKKRLNLLRRDVSKLKEALLNL